PQGRQAGPPPDEPCRPCTPQAWLVSEGLPALHAVSASCDRELPGQPGLVGGWRERLPRPRNLQATRPALEVDQTALMAAGPPIQEVRNQIQQIGETPMKREPVITVASLTAAVSAIITLAVSFGLDLTDDQRQAI